MKKRCYFVYTWDDRETQLPRFLETLKDMIEENSEGEIEVIYDIKSFKTGDNFEEKENLIYSSDSIVVFFSPKYKEKVERKCEKEGAYREYKKIVERKDEKIASIVPVIVKGDEQDAITKEFEKNIAQKYDIDDVFLKNKPKIKKTYIAQVERLVRKIIKETDLAYKKRDYKFHSKEEMMEALFGESEANKRLPNKCMYKTDAYICVMAQNRRYIIGRKGSGKSTFFELLEKYDVNAFEEKYKVLKPIKAEEIQMDTAYSIINSFSSDDKLFPLYTRLELFWEIYTYICAIYIVCLEEELFKIEDERSDIFRKAGDIFRKEKLNIEKLNSDDCHKAIFVSAIETFETFFKNNLIFYGKTDSFQASLVANYNIDNVMEIYFGKSLYKEIKKAILKCKKRIMIALDGFDRVSEYFRETTIHLMNNKSEESKKEAENRLQFESLFYLSMFNVFEKFKNKTKGLISMVSFCIIIPQDKLDQIKEKDRDFSKYNFANLSWDAYDLLQMIVKRLEYVYGEVDATSAVDKFKIIMKKNFKSIPLSVKIRIDEKDMEMELFEYLLRISFWRPRDIIKYFYEIYLANQKNAKEDEMLTSDILKDILYSKANDIIEQEFYAEYRFVIRNISDIMESFRGKNILIDLEEVYNILEKKEFKTASLREFDIPYNKLEMLYELSAIGIWVSRATKQEENLKNQICFNYNEGLEPLEILKGNKEFKSDQIKIVINPIFSKKLALKYNTKELLENYGWDYLLDNHTRKSSIRRI